jgi:putative redox protein
MSGKTHVVRLSQVGAAAFEATAAGGGTLIVDGPPDMGGEGRGMRPTELLLSALASCSAMDVVNILRKQRQPLEKLSIRIDGERADAVPAPFTKIQLTFFAEGAIDDHKLQRAVQLAVEKYCSVRVTLDPKVEITWTAKLGKPDADAAE